MSCSVSVTFAVIGDCEPKPKPVFTELKKSIRAINELNERMGIRFTASVGDLAHKGSVEQYEALTACLADLWTPFYAIMGNEELMGGRERFFHYCAQWNADPQTIPAGRYLFQKAGCLFVFASAEDDGVTFTEDEIIWLLEQVDKYHDLPVILFTHASPPGIYPDAGRRQMRNDLMTSVLQRPNVCVLFSGHTHFDLATVKSYVTDSYGVHHIHVPGIERTKVGDTHTPRFRIVTIDNGEDVTVRTYNAIIGDFERDLEIRFTLPFRAPRRMHPAEPVE
jgi:3',5'-cyclic AMP phosphodiesterase CpdA